MNDDTLTLEQLCDAWGSVLIAEGATRLQQKVEQFSVREILESPVATAMAWLVYALPPENDDVPPLLAARLLALKEANVVTLAPRHRLMVRSAMMSAALERGRVATFRECFDKANEEMHELSGEEYGDFSVVYIHFLLTAGEWTLRDGPLSDCVVYFTQALALTRSDYPPEVRFMALVGCALIHAVNGEPLLAQPLLAEAHEIGTRLEILSSAAGAKFFWCQAMVWDAVGEEEMILASVEKVRHLAHKRPWMELVQFFDATRNLYEGRIPDAIGALHRFLGSAGSLRKLPLLWESATMLLAITYVVAQQPAAALESIRHEQSCSHAVCLYSARAFAEIVRGNPGVVPGLTDACTLVANDRGHGTRARILVYLARAAAFEMLRSHRAADTSYSTALGIAAAYEVKTLFIPLSAEYFSAIQGRAMHRHRSALRLIFVPTDSRSRVSRAVQALTEKEKMIARMLLTTHTLVQISERLFISENTVKTHTRSIYKKLGVNSRKSLIELAQHWNLGQSPLESD